MKKDKRIDRSHKLGRVIPAGTEQETGLTRGETERTTGPVEEKPLKKLNRKASQTGKN